MSDDELKGEALHDRAAELDIDGRSTMTADELRDAVAKAERAQARAEAKAAKAAEEAAGQIVPGEMYPHTAAIPQTGEGDMSYSPAPENLPSVPSIELPSNVHDHSGGTHRFVSVPVEAND